MHSSMSTQYSSRSWLCAIALAVFDLDSGQKTEACVPEGELSVSELRSIAYGAFPVRPLQDFEICRQFWIFCPFRIAISMQEARAYVSDAKNGISDSSYLFRVRRCKSLTSTDDTKYLYCYVCARQWRDDRLHRGAEQRSIVLISEYPYSSILSPMAAVLGPALFPSFRSAAAEVMHGSSLLWPAPVPGTLAHLTIGPHRLIGRLPLDTCISDVIDIQTQPLKHRDVVPSLTAACLPLCGAFGEPVKNLEILLTHSKQLWKLWEVMLLAHPVMVFSCSASHSSAAVCALVSMIAPVAYAADYRPLLSIHDPAAQQLPVWIDPSSALFPLDKLKLESLQPRCADGWQSLQLCVQNMLALERDSESRGPTAVGVTNPYFLRAFEHCPNVMTIMHEPPALMPITAEIPQLANQQQGILSTLFTASGSFHPDLLSGKLDSLSLQRGLICGGQDRSVLAKLKGLMDLPSADNMVAACHVLRNHFHHLTVSFLLAFYDFLDLPCPWSPARQVSGLPAGKMMEEFNTKAFLRFLESYPTPDALVNIAGSKRKAHSLYQGFLESENFWPWISSIMNQPNLT